MKTIKLLSCLVATGVLANEQIATAQTYTPSNRIPVSDNSLGTQVLPTSNNNFDIKGGLNRGQTLFHSFTDFSIPTNGSANFINNTAMRDIITRVTGGNYSDLNGKLNSNGANFLLINPNGVVFGQNVQLNVGKAFTASTANGVDLVDGNGGKYTFGISANGDAPLLTIDPNVFLNISRLNMGANLPGSSGIVTYGTLQTTNPGQYIGLIGGNVTMNGGKVIAPGGRIELGGLVDFGSIGWGEENSFPKLTFLAGVNRSTVTLTDASTVSVAGNGGGSIGVNARDLNVLNGSQIGAGISQPAANSKAGDIVIDVTNNIEIGGNRSNSIHNEVAENSVGDAGNISIKTNTINLSQGSEIQASTKGIGNGGNVSITAQEVNVFEAPNAGNLASNINADVVNDANHTTSQGGNLTIDTGKLNLRNGTYLSADNLGLGRGGNLIIKAGSIDLFGAAISTDTFGKGNSGNLTIVANTMQSDASRISTSTIYDSGNAGNLSITADTLTLKNGTRIAVDAGQGTSGRGGNLTIKATDLAVLSSSISTDTFGSGTAGNLTIVASNLQTLDGARISASTYKDANAGNLTITTDTLQIKGGSGISASTYLGSGNAGDLTVNAKTVEIDGERPRRNNPTTTPSGLFAQVNSGGNGKGGTLRLNAQKLSVSNGGKVQSATFGKGNAGSLIITADEIDVFNSPDVTPQQPTNINTGVSFDPQGNANFQAEGNAGNLTIGTRRLSVRNGASISSDTKGIGNGGQLAITATESVAVFGVGSTLTVGVGSGAVGNGGELKLKTPQLVVKDGGAILTSSAGTGVAGKLTVNAKTIDLQNRGAITGETRSGKGGNIELNASDYLLIRQNSSISATAGTAQQGGDGGNIRIITPFIMALSGNNDITANAYTGNGGKVTILSDGLFGIAYREKGRDSNSTNDITASSTFGQSGSVQINTPGIDPGKDTGELPAAPNDASNQISQTCGASQRENKFYITGRGGLPPNASEPQESEALWQDARATKTKPATTATQPAQLAPPAIGWVFEKDGQVRLIAAQTAGGATKTRVVCPNQN
jgi:filamentous hemagglutinin family protein